MSVNRILPSDKNSIYLYLPISRDGEFECTLPFTDASKRERKLTLKRISTVKPFIPTNVQDSFDLTEMVSTSDLSQGVEKKFGKITFNVDKLYDDAFPIIKSTDLLQNKTWSKPSEVNDLYESLPTAEQTGLFMNVKEVNDKFDELKTKYTDLNADDNVMIFAEIGTKVTEEELTEASFKIDKLKLDLFNIYLFPYDFQFPRITENRTDNAGIEINVGGNAVFTHDVNLRSMIEYVMVDINKGDVRSAVHGSKRSLYYEFDVDDASGPITKYIWIWSIANPLPLYDTEHTPKSTSPFEMFHSFLPTFSNVKSEGLKKKQVLYGRNGTFLDVIGYSENNSEQDVKVSKTYNYHANNLLIDLSVLLNTSSYLDAQDNILMNVMRPNSGLFFASILNYINNQYDLEVYRPTENFVLELMAGKNQVTFPNGDVSFFEFVETIAFHELPNFSVSYYGNDLFLKLNCREVESSTLIKGDERDDLRVETILTVIKANDNVYQQFLSSDNQLVVQPPQFRPLASETSVESLILRNSNARLHFRFSNIKDEGVTFIPGDFVYLECDIEPTGSDGGY